MRMRDIHVFKRDGMTYRKVLSNAETWEELKDQLVQLNYNLDGLIAMDNKTHRYYDNPYEHLPEGEFSLFLIEETSEDEKAESLLHQVLLDGITGLSLEEGMQQQLGENWHEATNGELIHIIQRQDEEDHRVVLLLQEMFFIYHSLKGKLKDFVEMYTGCKLNPKDPILGGVSYEAGEAE